MKLKIATIFLIICGFLTNCVAQNNDQSTTNPAKQKSDYPKVQLSLYGGCTFNPIRIRNSYNADLKDYLRRNLFGVNYGLDVALLLKPKFGLGIKINENREGRFMSAVVRVLDPYYHPKYSVFEAFSCVTVGPYVRFLFDKNEKGNRKFLNIGLGYMYYQYQSIFANFIKVKTWTIGTFIDYGYHFELSQNSALLVKMSLYNGLFVYSKTGDTYIWFRNNSVMLMTQLNLSFGLISQN
jgi:hypothetical protein